MNKFTNWNIKWKIDFMQPILQPQSSELVGTRKNIWIVKRLDAQAYLLIATCIYVRSKDKCLDD